MRGESRSPLRLAAAAGQRHRGRQARGDLVGEGRARKHRELAAGRGSRATSRHQPPAAGLDALGAQHQVARAVRQARQHARQVLRRGDQQQDVAVGRRRQGRRSRGSSAASAAPGRNSVLRARGLISSTSSGSRAHSSTSRAVARRAPAPARCPRRRAPMTPMAAVMPCTPAPRTGSAAGSSGQRGRAAKSSGSAALLQALEPGPGDHRGIVGAQRAAAARRSAGRGSAASSSSAARTAVLAATPPATTSAVTSPIRSSARRSAVEHAVDRRLLEARGDVGVGVIARCRAARSTALLSPANEKCGSPLPTQRARQADGARIAFQRQPLDRRPAGIAEAEDLGGLVERLAQRVVDRRAEPAVAADALDPQQLAMAARDQQQQHRETASVGSASRGRQRVAFEVIDRDQRLVAGHRQRLGGDKPDHDSADQPRPGGRGDRVDSRPASRPASASTAAISGVELFGMGAGGDLGHDAAVGRVGVLLRGDRAARGSAGRR